MNALFFCGIYGMENWEYSFVIRSDHTEFHGALLQNWGVYQLMVKKVKTGGEPQQQGTGRAQRTCQW